MNEKQLSVLVVASMLCMALVTGFGNNVQAKEIECEDIAGKTDWEDDGHGDNEASEKKFFKGIEDGETFCEVNEKIDHEKYEGEIKEGTKHDLKWLKEQIYYQSVTEEVQECIDDAYHDSPDSDGDDNAADYELVECGY